MATQKSSKGNPASHRMANANLKARRERSWRRGQERKTARREAQAARAADNRAARARGEATPWQIAKARRAAFRQGAELGA